MADVEDLNLNRDQLAAFLPDHRAIIAFENLFRQSNTNYATLLVLIEEASIDANSAYALASLALYRSKFSLDYIDFNKVAPHATKSRRLAWVNNRETLNLHHSSEVTQRIGQDSFVYARNGSGAKIDKGAAVSFAGASVSNDFDIELFIADAVLPLEQGIGIASQDIENGAKGFVTNFGIISNLDTTGTPYGETWSEGDVIYASDTTAGDLTNVKPTTSQFVALGFVFVKDASAGQLFIRPQIESKDATNLTYEFVTSTHTITDKQVTFCDGTFTVTLPAASGNGGFAPYIKNTGSGTITLDGNGSDTIEGSLTISIGPGFSYQVMSDDTEWWII